MITPRQFLYEIRPTRPAMLVEGLDARETAIVGEHFAYLQRLVAQGIALMAGRTIDTGERTFGIVIFQADSEEAARAVMDNDPAVAQGVMRAELFPFSVLLWSPTGPVRGEGEGLS
jgi:uncharacterized protein YciI